ncbi:ribonuclease P protein component [Desulfurella amilsii]|uniref:ribonuclease P protein component n=1 Tax=Desulfurella amilsii TaxID=1562698 RepID=UPI001EF3FCF7|nr:ribonuclease P protein component [Desulfurella amilsii]
MKKSQEFTYLYTNGYRHVSVFFVVFLKKESSQNKRVAVVASKKIGNAVLRNKAKRRMREVMRLSKDYIKPGTSVVMIARKSVVTADFKLLNETFQKILEKFYKYEKNKQNS